MRGSFAWNNEHKKAGVLRSHLTTSGFSIGRIIWTKLSEKCFIWCSGSRSRVFTKIWKKRPSQLITPVFLLHWAKKLFEAFQQDW